MFSVRPLNFVFSRLSSFAPLCRASTSSVRHFCLFGRNLTRFRAKEPLRDQLQNVLAKNREAKEAPRADSIPPRPLVQVIIRGGLFFYVTSTIFSSVAAMNDFKMQKQFQSLIDQTIYEFRRTFSYVQPTRERKTEAVKLLWALIGANVAVFLLWRVPILAPIMWQYFSNSVASKSLCLPMLFSIFSHQHFMHLFLNMYVLKSFAIGAITLLGPAQFLAMYLSGGVLASWLSLCHKAVLGSKLPSVGASGAICAVMGYVLSKLPDTQVHLIFLPMFPFSAEYALYGFLAFELLCAFRIIPIHLLIPLDNFAHIGGLLFGIYYANYGEPNYQSQSAYFSTSWQVMGKDGGDWWKKSVVFGSAPKEKRHQNEEENGAVRAVEEANKQGKEMRHKLTEEKHKRQKDIEKRHKEWAKQMEEEREAVKERIRTNKQRLEERRKSGKNAESDDEDDDDDTKS